MTAPGATPPPAERRMTAPGAWRGEKLGLPEFGPGSMATPRNHSSMVSIRSGACLPTKPEPFCTRVSRLRRWPWILKKIALSRKSFGKASLRQMAKPQWA